MKRFLIIALILFLCVSGIGAEKIIEFPNLSKGHYLTIGKDQIYIMDNKAYKVYIYSRRDYRLLKTFGRKGQGPGEFNDNPGEVFEHQNKILVFAYRKVCLFSLKGEFIKDVKTPSFWIYPLGDRYVLKKSIFNNETARSEYGQYGYFLLDQNFIEIKEIFRIQDKMFGRRRKSGGKREVRTFPFYQRVVVGKDQIVLADSSKGLDFKIYDADGILIKEWNSPYEKIEVDDEIKKLTMRKWKAEFGSRWDRFRKEVKFVFPKFLPAFELFKLAAQKLYVFTHKIKDGNRELLVFNLEGKLLGTYSVPEDSIYKGRFKDGKFYYFMENEDTEMFELHMIAVQ